MLEAQFEDVINKKYYDEFVKVFKKYEDFPDIEKSNTSKDFFVENFGDDYANIEDKQRILDRKTSYSNEK